MENLNPRELVKMAGGPVIVARELGLTHGAVSQWRRVPAQHVVKMAMLAGIPAHQIRPDVFPAPQPEAA